MGLKSVPMLGQSEFVVLLKQSLFNALETASVLKLHGLFECFSIPAGEYLRTSEKSSPGLYIVSSGTVALVDPISQTQLDLIQTGGSFGVLSLFFQNLDAPDVFVCEDARVIMLDPGTFRMIELSDPALAILMLRCIVMNFAPTVKDLSSLVRRMIRENSPKEQ